MVTLRVEKVVMGGDGLSRLPDGRAVFIPYALPGEKVKVRIIQEKKDYAVGRIADILEPSPHRVRPRCRHYGSETSHTGNRGCGGCYGCYGCYGCGGCQFQHVTYQGELNLKQNILAEVIRRQLKLEIEPLECHPSPGEWGYRNKSEHRVAGGHKSPKIGYYRRRSHEVIDINECPVLDKESVTHIKKFKEIICKSGEPIYDEETHTGNLRHLVLKRSSGEERLFGVVTRTSELKPQTLRRLLEVFGEQTGVLQNVSPEPGNRILGRKTNVLSGRGHLAEDIDSLKLKVSFDSFFQGNHAQAEVLTRLARKYIEPQPADVICDAYAGVGMLGLSMAADAAEIIAVESNPSSVADGRDNIHINQIPNARFLPGEAGDVLPEINSDKLVCDPPRKGLGENVINAIISAKPRKICYVSCNPSTWARDARLLLDAGYSLKRLSWVDMFPRTAHIEVVSLLEAE